MTVNRIVHDMLCNGLSLAHHEALSKEYKYDDGRLSSVTPQR